MLSVPAAMAAGTVSPPLACQGYLNLNNWDFSSDGVVALNGEWEFYWQELISPGSFDKSGRYNKSSYFILPGRWDGKVINNKKQSGDGYATFRLLIDAADVNETLAVRIKDESSAYRLWVNGRLIAQNGIVGTTATTTVPQYLIQVKAFKVDHTPLEFVLQVANFHHRKGGVWSQIELGSSETLVNQQSKIWALDLFVCGSLLTMAVYYLLVFVLRQREKSALYFSLFCFIIVIRTLFVNSRFFVFLFPSLPWEWVYTIEISTVTLVSAIMLMFISTLFPRQTSVPILRLVQGGSMVLTLFVVCFPARLSSYIVPVNQQVILFLSLYITFVLIRAVRAREVGAWPILSGFLVFYAASVNDVLTNQDIIATPYFASFGMMFLVFAQSCCLTKRIANTFNSAELLAKELEEKNRAFAELDRLKDDFLANTSHELRTPLSGIIGLAESLRQGAMGAIPVRAKENLAMISSSAWRLSSLVNDLIDLSHLKNRDIKLQIRAVDVRALVANVMAVLAPLAKGKPLRLENEIPVALPSVMADENRLQQIFFNLIGNAIKFTPQGQIIVKAQCVNEQVHIQVSDSGIGIPESEYDRIFQSFEQGDGSRTRAFGGTGLGLSICKRLLELHGSDLELESRVDHGSTFSFSLSVCTEVVVPKAPEVFGSKVNAAPMVAVNECIPAPALTGTQIGRVLLVDDEPVNLQVASNHLILAGLTVETACDGEEALRMISANPPDLVLLDLMMPKLSGYEVCRQLRRDYSTSQMPIIMLTARNRIADLVEGFKAGANDYLTKPFWQEDLLARVRCQLKIKEAYVTAQENAALKQDVKARQQTEQDLRHIQLRLAGLLHSVDEALLAINQSEEIVFINHCGEQFFGYECETLIGRPLQGLVPEASREKLILDRMFQESVLYEAIDVREQAGNTRCVDVVVSALELEDEILSILIFRPAGHRLSQDNCSLALIKEINQNRQYVQMVEEALHGVLTKDNEHASELLVKLQHIDTALDQLGQQLAPQDKNIDVRVLVLEAMTLAVDCWVEATGKNKADLARASGLWKVHTNLDGWERTQTLDRYLDISTVPLKPRLKVVFQTVDFVLDRIQMPSSLTDALAKSYAQLRLMR